MLPQGSCSAAVQGVRYCLSQSLNSNNYSLKNYGIWDQEVGVWRQTAGSRSRSTGHSDGCQVVADGLIIMA